MDNDNTDNVDIPIECTDLIIFEDAISSVKEKFINEMKRMDEEMNQLSSELMRLYAQSSTLRAEVAPANAVLERQSPSNGQGNWESLASSPLVEGEGENKILKLQFDVSQFDPDEVKVKIQNETLVVSAAHEENCDTSSMVRQFHREFKFPKGVDPCTIHSTLFKDGVLIVEAPLPQLHIDDKNSRCSTKSSGSE